MEKGQVYAMSMEVAVSALLSVNPTEFYTKALLQQRSTSYFRQLLNIKTKTKVGNIGFNDPIQLFDCSFNATDANLSAKEFEPCKLKINVEVCLDDIETSFVAQWLKAGSNAEILPQEFETHFFEELGKAVSNSLEYLTFRGDITLDPEDFGSLAYCDGLEKKLAYALIPAGQRIAATATTAANIIAKLQDMYNRIPAAYKNRTTEILWMIPTAWAGFYKQAVAAVSAEMYFVKDAQLSFLGIPLVVAEGMSDNKSFISMNNDPVFITDLLSDQEAIEVIDMRKTTGEYKIRVVSTFKFGVDLLNDENFVTYGITQLP